MTTSKPCQSSCCISTRLRPAEPQASSISYQKRENETGPGPYWTTIRTTRPDHHPLLCQYVLFSLQFTRDQNAEKALFRSLRMERLLCGLIQGNFHFHESRPFISCGYWPHFFWFRIILFQPLEQVYGIYFGKYVIHGQWNAQKGKITN